MTREEILNMEAGREMDALVAEKVMGEPYPDRFAHPKWWGLRYDMGHEVWEPMLFSTNIKMAWEVVERLQSFELEMDYPGAWRAGVHFAGDPSWATASADTAPFSICR